MRLQLKNNDGKFFYPVWIWTGFPDTKSQCATNELCWPQKYVYGVSLALSTQMYLNFKDDSS